MQNTPKNKMNDFYKRTGRAYWIILFATILLLISLTVSFFVVLAISNNGENPDENTPKPNVNTVKPIEGSTGIFLPSETPSKSYLSASVSGVKAIEGISSSVAILVDIDSNTSVAEKNADVKIYPASMTKVMILLVACENAKDPNKLLTVSSEMVAKYEKAENKGASVAFTWEEGNQVSVEDALYMIMYESDTYACWLLAEYISGSEEAFVKLMNERAASLGLKSTNYTNCTGLFNQNHYTTAREMAAVMAAAVNNPTAFAVMSKTSQHIVELYENGEKSGETVGMWSGWYTGRLEANKLQGVAPYYAGGGSDIMIDAGKTGYETIPTSCFVTSGTDTETGKKYVCVQVGRIHDTEKSISSKTSTDDTRIIYQKYAK